MLIKNIQHTKNGFVLHSNWRIRERNYTYDKEGSEGLGEVCRGLKIWKGALLV